MLTNTDADQPSQRQERRHAGCPGAGARRHDDAVRFADVVATTGEVTATRARSRKVAALAGLFARLGPDEVPIVVAILTGTPRQGRIGIGWRTVAAIEEPPATEPQLEIADVDDALERIDALRGTGSQAAGVPLPTMRRAAMLGGDLPSVANL